MVTMKDFTFQELCIAANMVQEMAIEKVKEIKGIEDLFTGAGAEVPDIQWKREQADILARLVLLLDVKAQKAKEAELIQSN